jgi:hypothetical protein
VIVSFPPPPSGPYDQYLGQYLGRVLDVIRRALASLVSVNEATPRIILRSPGGRFYDVTVDDNGNLLTAVNTGKTSP